ncbi:Na(+)/H(+) antiporter subunit B [Thioalkalivibrio sp. HK1]|uniref:Na(+)/H(+) antiporter subunit B n=1 Tax=Thioalkalivibrio sp. HK1 TaxID=1469245 RepID=UPI00046E5457|nr:Na(+)/H(+) antiporter subunit B [Thioalkalivibrio sp. HK1]
MRHNLVLKSAAKITLPFILLFALYVQFHGDYGPGGGFQAGAIFGAGIILYGLVFGTRNSRILMSPGIAPVAAVIGVFLYTGVGIVSMLLGANFLDYDVLAASDVAGQHLGILLVEFGVGLAVMSVMVIFFHAFVATAEEDLESESSAQTEEPSDRRSQADG